MSRQRISSIQQALFAGVAPNTGFNFLSTGGLLNNNFQSGTDNRNLVKYIDHVTNCSYSISDVSRVDVKQLGNRGTVSQPIISFPTVELNFNYFQSSLKNEYNLGFYVNSGVKFKNPLAVSCISGFISRSLADMTGESFYPKSYTDKRNYYLEIGKEGIDVVQTGATTAQLFSGDGSITSHDVVGLGNGYIVAYNTQCTTNSVPEVSIKCLCENLVFYSGNTGMEIPAIDPLTRTQITNTYFNLPTPVTDDSVLIPSNLLLSITTSGSSGISGLGIDFNNLSLQNYSIDLTLPRVELNSLGYKLPLDREINFPLFATVGFSTVMNNISTGTLDNVIKSDVPYDITIQLQSGVCTGLSTVIRYDLLGSKLKSITYEGGLGGNKIANFSFLTEINPDKTGQGFYMSGIVN